MGTSTPAMQDLYKDLEERLQELSNLSSVSNLLVRHVLALPGDGRALSPCLSTHESTVVAAGLG